MTLKFARVIRDPSSGLSELAQKPKPNLVVSLENLVSLVARDVRFNAQVGLIHADQAASPCMQSHSPCKYRTWETMTEVTMASRRIALLAADEQGECTLAIGTREGVHHGTLLPSSGMRGAATLSSGPQIRMMTAEA